MYIALSLFFKQQTAYDMRISDWSSDVCSSDLDLSDLTGASGATILLHAWDRYRDCSRPVKLHRDTSGLSSAAIAELDVPRPPHPWKIGRATCRERVCQYV